MDNKLLEQLKRMSPEERSRPMVQSLGGAGSVTAEDLLNELQGKAVEHSDKKKKLIQAVVKKLA